MPLLLGIAAALSTLLGGLFALKRQDKLHRILGFSAGAVIGVAFFDLMPEALELGSKNHELGFVTSIIALGFTIYLVLDRWIILHRHHEDETHAHSHVERGIWGAGTLSMH